jgi:flagella basal body P-ring formation protein FlgA
MFSLEATALQNGACGARVRARVAVTGAMVEMTVLDSGAGVLSGKAAAWQ